MAATVKSEGPRGSDVSGAPPVNDKGGESNVHKKVDDVSKEPIQGSGGGPKETSIKERAKACCLDYLQPSLKRLVFVVLTIAAAVLISHFVGGVRSAGLLSGIAAGALVGSMAFAWAVTNLAKEKCRSCCAPSDGYYKNGVQRGVASSG